MKEHLLNDILHSPDPLSEVLDALRRKQFTLRDAGVSSRVYNHWRSLGLVPEAGEEGKQAWLDFPQYLWLKVAQDLRSFGLPTEEILAVKELLFTEADPARGHQALREGILDPLVPQSGHLTAAQKQEYEALKALADQPADPDASGTFLEAIIGWQLVFRSRTSLVVVPGERPFLWSEDFEAVQPELRERLDRPHLMVPFSHYIFAFVSDEGKEQFLHRVPVLSREEAEVLHALRNRQVRELTVKFVEKGKARQMDLVTKTDRPLTEEQVRQVSQILSLGHYTTVTMKSNKGTQLYFEREERRRL